MKQIVNVIPENKNLITPEYIDFDKIIAHVYQGRVTILMFYRPELSHDTNLNKYCFSGGTIKNWGSHTASDTAQHVVERTLETMDKDGAKLYQFDDFKDFAIAVIQNDWK